MGAFEPGDRSSFGLFILFCLASLSHGWRRLNLTCSDELLLVSPRTQSAVHTPSTVLYLKAGMRVPMKFQPLLYLLTSHLLPPHLFSELIQLVTLITLEHFILVMNLGVLPSPCTALIEYNCSVTPACPLLGKVNFTNARCGLMPSFTSLIRIMACHKF